MPTVSVIVPTRDRPAYLAEALASVMTQTVDDWECIVVNDAGRTPRLPEDRRFRLLHHDHQRGPAAARNAGVDVATGDVLCFLDDDDWYQPRRLQMALDGLASAPLSICWSRYHDEQHARGRDFSGYVHDIVLNDFAPGFGATAVLRSSWELIDTTYLAAEDLEWWLRVSSHLTVTTIKQCGCVYRRHAEVRGLHGDAERITQSLRLMEENAAYFSSHPSAAAFRWRRISTLARHTGDRHMARRAARRALRLRPSLGTVRTVAASFR